MDIQSKWRKVNNFRALSNSEKRILIAAATILPCTILGLRLFGYKRSSARLERWAQSCRWGRIVEDEAVCIRRTVQLMRLAIRYVPLQSNCLSQSLTLWALLKCQGIASDLRIGVRSVGDQLQAHAWIEYQGQPVNEMADVKNRFVPFSESMQLNLKSLTKFEASVE